MVSIPTTLSREINTPFGALNILTVVAGLGLVLFLFRRGRKRKTTKVTEFR